MVQTYDELTILSAKVQALELAHAALLAQLEKERRDHAAKEAALSETRDAATRANHAKNVFLSSMSHELRTPLNAIIGFAQVLINSRKNPLSPPQIAHVNQIYKAGQHLLSLINEVLDLTAIESDKIRLDIERVCVSDVIAATIELIAPEIQKSSVQFINQMPQDADVLPLVHADAMRMRQALLNLLTNAIKYNRPKGSVFLSAEIVGDYLRIGVRDTGYGIDPSRRHELFRPFSRLTQENGNIEGTGIGLMLTKKLMENMQGKISFESEMNVGTVFFLDFLLAKPDLTAGKSSDLDELCPPLQPCDKVNHANSPSIRVLYIEDDASNRAFMEAMFAEHLPYDLRCVKTAERALEGMANFRPDVILIDLCLPGRSGLELAQLLQNTPEFADIPRISVSSAHMDFKSPYFVDHFNKPVDGCRLFHVLTHLFLDHLTPSVAV